MILARAGFGDGGRGAQAAGPGRGALSARHHDPDGLPGGRLTVLLTKGTRRGRGF